MTLAPSPKRFLRPKHPSERRPGGDGRAGVGLTGGLSAGKSTALSFFAELGARVISADAIVHHLYERPEVRQMLAREFGDSVLDAVGGVDRRALGAAVAGDAERIRRLESLVHPLVAGETDAFLAAAAVGDVSVCEVPLLFESSLERLFDLVVTVEAPRGVRRGRVEERMEAEVFTALDSRLAGEETRSGAADAVFVNDGSVEDLRSFVEWVYESARALAAAHVSVDPGSPDSEHEAVDRG